MATNNVTCVLCEEAAVPGREFCPTHKAEYEASGHFFAIDFLRVKMAEIRTAALAYMELVQCEAEHMRKRARQLLANEIAPQHLANSVILHCNNIAKERA